MLSVVLRKTTGTRYAQILEVCHKKQLMLLFFFGQPTPNAWLQLDTYNKYTVFGQTFLKTSNFCEQVNVNTNFYTLKIYKNNLDGKMIKHSLLFRKKKEKYELR